MKRKDLFMGSTEIEAIRTIGDIQSYLVRMGATQVATQFENGEPSGLYFTLLVGTQIIPFQLPARTEPIYKILHAGRNYRTEASDRSQAKRTAWRQIYRWIQAQLALVETGMAKPDEVMMPYIQVAPNQTLYQKVVAGGMQRLLPEAFETVKENNV